MLISRLIMLWQQKNHNAFRILALHFSICPSFALPRHAITCAAFSRNHKILGWNRLPINLAWELQVSFTFSFQSVTAKGIWIQHTEHKIHGSDHSHSIGKKMAFADVVKASQVGKTRGTNVHAVWPFGAIADNIDAHLTLGSFNGRVGVSGRYGITLGVEQEMVDQGLHVLLHGGAGRWRDLVVLNADGAGGHLVEALQDDAKRLSELLHTAEVTVVAITVDANRHIELDLVIGIVRLALADIPWDARSTEHDTSEGEIQSIGGRDNTNTLETVDPDTVVRKHFLGLVDPVAKLGGPLVDVVKEANGKILVDTTWADIGSMETGTRDTLVEFLECMLASLSCSAFA